MNWPTFFRRRPLSPQANRRRRTVKLSLEVLEGRTLPAVITPFTPRFSTNDTGDIVFAANTVVRADPSNPNAANAQNGVGSGTAINNNGYTMVNVDVDGVASTFNSSRATLNLPAGATVLFAGLYWGAESASASRNQVLLDTPAAGGYVPVTGVVVGSTGSNDYQGFADVTSLVQAAGNGTFTVANVQANVNATDKHGGWSLVVAYRDPAAPARNLTVFDGFAVIQNAAADRNVTINVSGFQTPPSGPVNAKVGFVAYEGDRGSDGDSATLRSGPNSRVLSDTQNPANNFFNSTISNVGNRVSSKDPDFINQLGFDADIVQANGVIPNGATSASVSLTTGGETYFPGVVTTVIDLFAPRIDTVKAVTDLDGGQVEPGDILEYTVVVTNTGGDAAGNVVLSDLIPANATFAGSLAIDGAPQSNAAGDDRAEFDGANNRVVFRLGAGANAATGGALAIGASTTITFRVQVNAGVADGTQVTNQAAVDFTGVSTGIDLTDSSNPSTVIVSNRADLVVTKVISNPNPNVGETITFTVTLTNNGPQDATGVQLTDQLPPSFTFIAATTSQGTYNPATGLWTVGPLANGATVTLTIDAVVATAAPSVNRAQITASDQPDPNPNNNFDAVTTPPQSADLVVTKIVDNATPNVGDTVVFTVTLINNGPDNATTVSLTDLLPAGLQFVAAIPGQGSYDAATGIWTVGTVVSAPAGGAAVTLTILARVVSPVGQTNTAAIRTVDQFDPDPSNNSDDAVVTARRADLRLLKEVNNPRPTAGQQITYTVTLVNDGPDAATNVTVLDLLPPEVTLVSGVPSAGSFDSTSNIWTVPTINPGAANAVTLRLTVRVNAAGVLTNMAIITAADQFDPDPSNNTANVTLAPQQANLALRKMVNTPRAVFGSLVVFTLVVRNRGAGAATNVVVRDPLSRGLAFVTARATRGAYNPSTGLWRIAHLPPGAVAVLHVVVRINTLGPVVNAASVSAAQFDPELADNRAVAAVLAMRNASQISKRSFLAFG